MKKLPLQGKFRVFNNVDRFSFYFFLFFSSFVFGNLFPSISLTYILSPFVQTSLQPFRFLLGPLWAISVRFFLTHSQSQTTATALGQDTSQAAKLPLTPMNQIRPLEGMSGQRQQSWQKPETTNEIGAEKRKNFWLRGFRDLKPKNSAAVQQITTQHMRTHLLEKPAESWASDIFQPPNFLSAALAVCLYEFFSYLEHRLLGVARIKTSTKFMSPSASTKLTERLRPRKPQETSMDQVRPQELQSASGFGPRPDMPRRIRILRTFKIGFFLGLFVDAFKVGS
jgi:hypothetical protein